MTLRRSVVWLVVYSVLVVVLLAPLSLNAGTEMPDDGDSILGLWILWWGATHVSLGYPGVLDANAYYPHERALAYTEPLLGQALLSWPLFRFLDNRVLATNLATLSLLVLSAFGGHLLFRELTESDAAAMVGAAYFALGSYNLSQIPRLQLVTLSWLALALLCLHRFFVRDEKRYLAGFVLFSVLHGLSCFYYLLFYGLILGVLVPVYFFGWRTYEKKSSTLWLALSGIAIGIFFLFIASPFLELYDRYEFSATPNHFDLVRYFYPPAENPIYGAFARPRLVDHFLGFGAVLVAAWGFFSWHRAGSQGRARRIAWAFLVMGVLGFFLSAGPHLIFNRTRLGPGPFQILAQFGPFENLRDPSRMVILPRLAMSAFIAYAALALFRNRGRLSRALGCGVLAALLLLEQWSPRYGRGDRIPVENVPDAYAWLGASEGKETIAELPVLPFRFVRFNTLEAYFSSFHEGDLLFNKPSFYPPVTEFLRWELRNFPDDTSTTLLSALGVDAALVHPKRWEGETRRRRMLRRLDRRGDQLPLIERFPDRPDDAEWKRFQLGNEQLHAIVPLASEGAPRECRCRELDRGAFELRSRRGNPQLAGDGDRATSWTTHRGQLRGDYIEIVFDRPRRPARIEIEMAFPWEEFARNLELIGFRDRRMSVVPQIEDVWYKVALARQLVEDPTSARLRYDLEPMTVDSIRLRIAQTDPGAQPWSVPEIHVYVQTDSPLR